MSMPKHAIPVDIWTRYNAALDLMEKMYCQCFDDDGNPRPREQLTETMRFALGRMQWIVQQHQTLETHWETTTKKEGGSKLTRLYDEVITLNDSDDDPLDFTFE